MSAPVKNTTPPSSLPAPVPSSAVNEALMLPTGLPLPNVAMGRGDLTPQLTAPVVVGPALEASDCIAFVGTLFPPKQDNVRWRPLRNRRTEASSAKLHHKLNSFLHGMLSPTPDPFPPGPDRPGEGKLEEPAVTLDIAATWAWIQSQAACTASSSTATVGTSLRQTSGKIPSRIATRLKPLLRPLTSPRLPTKALVVEVFRSSAPSPLRIVPPLGWYTPIPPDPFAPEEPFTVCGGREVADTGRLSTGGGCT
mmetsp:Transcript_18318/g.50504  ORF Transcript_18318/g.50504 Transcript_18318/m.50504 type:complete len:252 (+) Transcript_18318:3124-3879(+)